MKYTIFVLASSLLLLFSACRKDKLWKEGDFFFLRHKGADMPVWLRGNIQSNIFILHLHGGPGGSSIDEAVAKVYLPLEKDYAMLYWDQRASGASQGRAQAETIHMEQFVEDLELLIDLVQSKYDNPKIFLHGHSWGGALGAAFLGKDGNQNKVAGWIELNGAHNWKLGMELSVQWVQDYANRAIQEGKEADFWASVLDWYREHPVINSVELMDLHTEYVGRANGYIYDAENPNLKQFSSWELWGPSGDLNNDAFVKEQLIVELGKSYSEGLGRLRTPSLILWGRHDGILPVALAQEAYNALGTDDKHLFIFENSAHSPNREEPDAFIREFRQFIERYK